MTRQEREKRIMDRGFAKLYQTDPLAAHFFNRYLNGSATWEPRPGFGNLEANRSYREF